MVWILISVFMTMKTFAKNQNCWFNICPKPRCNQCMQIKSRKYSQHKDWRTIRQVLIMLSGDGLTEAVVQHAGSKIVAAQCQIEIDPCSDLLTLLPCLLACLPGWSSRALGISCWAYFKVLCILADYRHSGHASLFISHEKTGWPLLESPSRNSKWSHHGIKQQSRSIVTLRSIDLTVRSRSVAPMEDDIGLLAPHSW